MGKVMPTLDTTKIDIEEAIALAERAISAFRDTRELIASRHRGISSSNMVYRRNALQKHGAAVARIISPMIEHAELPESLKLRALIVLADLETYL